MAIVVSDLGYRKKPFPEKCVGVVRQRNVNVLVITDAVDCLLVFTGTLCPTRGHLQAHVSQPKKNAFEEARVY